MAWPMISSLDGSASHRNEAVLVGVGQLGGVFAHGLLRLGLTVVPVRRGESLQQVKSQDPALVLVAVGEKELAGVLEALPSRWHDRVALLQNELLPGNWQSLACAPTVASVWFEKKKPIAPHVIRSTPIFGPKAPLLVEALGTLDLAAHVIDEGTLVSELVLKNLYILTANIAGLRTPTGTTTGALWTDHRNLAESIAQDALTLQRALLREGGQGDAAEKLDSTALMAALGEAFMADPNHGACGRSAPARKERALAQSASLDLTLPHLSA